jgi:HEAT repeat protein
MANGRMPRACSVLGVPMKKLSWMVIAVAAAGCSTAEPIYQGKPLGAWITSLKDRDPAVRQDAIQALGQMGEEVVPRLTEALKDTDNRIRMGAADALGRIGPLAKDALPALDEALRDSDKNVRRHAAFALGVVDPEDKSVLPTLMEALKDTEREVRRQAAIALGRFGPEAKAAVPALNEALRQDEESFRWVFQKALEQITEAYPN